MYEYRIINKSTNEEDVIFGHTYADAYRRAGLNPAEWVIDYQEYVD